MSCADESFCCAFAAGRGGRVGAPVQLQGGCDGVGREVHAEGILTHQENEGGLAIDAILPTTRWLTHMLSQNVTKLKLVPNVAAPTAEESKADASSGASYWTGITKGQWMCPVTREETNGKVPFVFLRTCGCVFADKALREVKSSTCMSCGKDFAPDDVIKLCPLPDEEAAMRTRMVERRRAAKAAKRSAGTGAGATAGGAGGEPSVGAAADAGSSALASRRKREDGGSREDRKAKRARDAASASTWRPMAATANGAGAAAPSTTSAAVAAMVARADASLKKKRGASESFSSLFAAPETKAPSSAGLFIRTAAPAFSQKRGVD